MWARARWCSYFPLSAACDRFPPEFGGGGAFLGAVGGREILPFEGGLRVTLDLLGRMYMPGSPGTVPRYMLPDIVGAGIGMRRAEPHRVKQGGLWCSQRGWSMLYGVMWTGKGPTARCNLWGKVMLRRATARVLECRSLIYMLSVCDAAGFRQSLMMHVFVRLSVVSDTLARGGPMRRIVWSSWRVRILHRPSCRCWTSWAGVCTPGCSGFLLGRSAVWKGVGQQGV